MSVFGEEIIDRLHENSALRDKANPMRKILDYGVGEWFDRFVEDNSFDDFFLDSATGGYLDAWGREFNVPRRLDESDTDYRHRIVLESLGHLTVPYLQDVYGLILYCFVSAFDPSANMLTSDNPYACNRHMVLDASSVESILKKKFVIGTELLFLEDGVVPDYIITTSNTDLIFDYLSIYDWIDIHRLFMRNRNLKKVKLVLPKAVFGFDTFAININLTDVDLDMINIVNVNSMFSLCDNLKNVKLNMPSVTDWENIFRDCPALETINVTINEDFKEDFKEYVLDLNLTNLTSFILNGEEVEL